VDHFPPLVGGSAVDRAGPIDGIVDQGIDTAAPASAQASAVASPGQTLCQ